MPEVVVKPGWHASVLTRIAVIIARAHRAMDIGGWAPDGVIGDDQVKQAVVVVVKPGGCHTECSGRLAADAGGGRQIGECAIAVVVVEGVPPGAAHEQVLVAIVIIISHCHSEVEVEIGAGKSRLSGNILKRAVALLVEKAVVEGRVSLLQIGKSGPVSEKDIQPAVIVEIENGYAAAHRLRKVLSPGEAVVRNIGDLRPR